MVYISKGKVGSRRSSTHALLGFFIGIWNLLSLFFRTLINPAAVLEQRQRDSDGGGGHGRTGAGNSGRSRPNRVTGLSDLGSGGSIPFGGGCCG
ncbi:hypothetical protein ACKKBG_A00345 [Auxenochlorella protothecoides x Auxenochlorella symbiontica]